MSCLGSAVLARHRAQNAADLGALAGAVAVAYGEGEPCDRVRDLVARQEGPARLTACVLDGDQVLVDTAVTARLGRWGIQQATARARAGSVE